VIENDSEAILNISDVLKPALEAKGITVKMATPLLAHVDRMIEKNVECESNAGFVTTHDFAMLRKSMRKAVMVIDEIGLATPHHFAALKFINPAGIILLGDHRQLSSAGDLLRIIQRLEVSVINLEPHANDRFNGCQGMRNVLKILEDEIDKQYAAGMHSSPGPGMWPGVELEKRLEAAGLRFVDDRTGDVVLGWRHKIVDPLGGKTVHSTQGDTITDTIFVADYKCDPRLLYTAISRSVLLSNVSVQRSCTTYNANGT